MIQTRAVALALPVRANPPSACVFRLLLRLVIVLGAVLAGLGAVMIGPGAWGTFCFRTRY
jgi:hypothetical protein